MFVDSCTYTVSGKQYTRYLPASRFVRTGKLPTAPSPTCLAAPKPRSGPSSLPLSTSTISTNSATSTRTSPSSRVSLAGPWRPSGKSLNASAWSMLWARPQDGKRALWQVFARVLEQGSRLSAVRLANAHAACDILELDVFDEDDLYDNLQWLAEHQEQIEDRLFRFRYGTQKPDLYLYDVTSSYLEGVCNVLGAFGYCRDGKKGKMQVVYGLLCDFQGIPVAIEAFPGNTTDTKTFGSQVHKVTNGLAAGRSSSWATEG